MEFVETGYFYIAWMTEIHYGEQAGLKLKDNGPT